MKREDLAGLIFDPDADRMSAVIPGRVQSVRAITWNLISDEPKLGTVGSGRIRLRPDRLNYSRQGAISPLFLLLTLAMRKRLRPRSTCPTLFRTTLRSTHRPQVGCPIGESMQSRQEKGKEKRQSLKNARISWQRLQY